MIINYWIHAKMVYTLLIKPPEYLYPEHCILPFKSSKYNRSRGGPSSNLNAQKSPAPQWCSSNHALIPHGYRKILEPIHRRTLISQSMPSNYQIFTHFKTRLPPKKKNTINHTPQSDEKLLLSLCREIFIIFSAAKAASGSRPSRGTKTPHLL